MFGFHLNGSYVSTIAKKIVSSNVWILFELLTYRTTDNSQFIYSNTYCTNVLYLLQRLCKPCNLPTATIQIRFLLGVCGNHMQRSLRQLLWLLDKG